MYPSYPRIEHLPGSKMGRDDRQISSEKALIATNPNYSKDVRVIVTEKLDGSNVGIVKQGGLIVPITRSGQRASSSKLLQHQKFAAWVRQQQFVLSQYLDEGDYIVGEWLLQAHSTRYKLSHHPFVVIDWFSGGRRISYENFLLRTYDTLFEDLGREIKYSTAELLHLGGAIGVKEALERLGEHGKHGAIDLAEGAVWRVEKQVGGRWEVDFLAKFVRPENRMVVIYQE